MSSQNHAAWSIPSLLHQEENLLQIRINESVAQRLIGSVNCAMAGNTGIEHLSRAHLGRQFAKNMFTSSINALAYSKDESEEAMVSASTADINPEDIPLPAIRLEEGEMAAPELLVKMKDQGIFFIVLIVLKPIFPTLGRPGSKIKRTG